MTALSPLRHWLASVLIVLSLLSSAAAQSPQRTQTILVMGDSLSAGYGMAARQGWVSLLNERMQREFPNWKVANASISGETTSGGASRIAREIARHQPAIVIIELGGNDGLRGLPMAGAHGMRSNLSAMIETAQRNHAHVLLLGMQMPPNLGADYTREFARTWPEPNATRPRCCPSCSNRSRTSAMPSSPTISTRPPPPNRALWSTSGPPCGP